jgi:hypothetical protein
LSEIDIYAQPQTVTDLADCYFYHTTEVPGYGVVEGEWDLRRGIRSYLGGVDFSGKRVLELGTASGFICFHMESKGADVIGYDLSEKQSWDVVPYAQYSYEEFLAARKEHIRKVNNAFWLCHRSVGSRSKVLYGDVYSVPAAIGRVDISTFCSILLHVRDPFLALQRSLALTRETVIVTDLAEATNLPNPFRRLKGLLPSKLATPAMRFRPNWHTCEPKETWWRLSPEIIQRFIGVLGFGQSKVSYHYQLFRRGSLKIPIRLYTIVANRTVPIERTPT